MAPMRLRFFFDWGTTTCLWADDAEARSRLGYAVEPRDLPLAPALVDALEQLAIRHDGFLNWADPAAPHDRSPADCRAFDLAVAELVPHLREALGPDFELVDQSRPVTP